MFYQKKPGQEVQCLLCPHCCQLKEEQVGRCRGKVNQNGVLYAQNYGQTTGVHLDPIEKKPLYHFYPGSLILSLGPNGCNLNCIFCQNWTISQEKSWTQFVSPQKLVQKAKKLNSIGLAYTYTEPLIWYEFVYDTASAAHSAGLKNVLVTNGFINPAPLKKLLPFIDAFNIDLKAIEEEFYQKYCGGRLKVVQKSIELVQEKAHLEITNLVIPGMNDDLKKIETLIKWITELNPEIPVHFSRYYPHYQLKNPPTSEKLLEKIYRLASTYLKYVYLGNVSLAEYNHTYCPHCKEIVIERWGYEVVNRLKGHTCPSCGVEIKLIF